MPEPPRDFLPTYRFINTELDIIASDLADLAVNTDTKITFEEARQAHLYLNVILRHYILAARAQWALYKPSQAHAMSLVWLRDVKKLLFSFSSSSCVIVGHLMSHLAQATT